MQVTWRCEQPEQPEQLMAAQPSHWERCIHSWSRITGPLTHIKVLKASSAAYNAPFKLLVRLAECRV